MKMKLMVMTLVVAMLLSMSAFAASVSYTSLVPTEINDGADYSIVVNYSASGYNTGDQVTLLVLTEDDEIIFDTTDATKPTNVAYIDQATITGETGSFEFTVAKSFITSNEVYVKLGATAQATAAAGTYTFETEVDGTKVDVTVDDSCKADVFAETGLSLVVVTTDATLAEGKTIAINGTIEMFYTEYNGVKKYIALKKNFDAETDTFDIVDGTMRKIVYGDINGGGILANDALMAVRYAGGASIAVFNNDPDFARLSADVNGDGKILANDALMIVRRAGGNTVNFAAESR